MTDYWSQFQEVTPQKDYWSQFEVVDRPKEKDYTLGRIATVDKGATFGMGRKLGGVLNAIGAAPVDALLTDKSLKDAFKDRYAEIADEALSAQQEYAQDKPVEATGLEIATSLANPLNRAGIGYISKGATTGAKALRSVGVGGGVGGVANALDTENIEEVPQKALTGLATGSAIGGAFPLVGAGVKGGLKTLKHVLGKTTGAGERAIGDAFKAGVEGDSSFLAKMRSPVEAENLEKKVLANFSKIKEKRGRAYSEDMSRLKQETAGKKLDLKPVIDDVRNIIKQEGGGAGYLVDDETARVLDKTKGVLNNFYKDKNRHNLEGFDNLKKALQNIKTQEGTNAERVKTQIANSVRGQIMKQSPKYKAIEDAYAKDSAIIDDLKSVFSLNRNANSETVLKKIQSTARDNANTDWGYRAQLLKQIDPTGEIQKEISANALHNWTPRGLFGSGAFYGGFYGANPLVTLSSLPRAAGYLSYGTGRASQKVPAFSNILPYLSQFTSTNTD